jgi:hypothetical protein
VKPDAVDSFLENEIRANLTTGRFETRRMGPARRELECLAKRRRAWKGAFSVWKACGMRCSKRRNFDPDSRAPGKFSSLQTVEIPQNREK